MVGAPPAKSRNQGKYRNDESEMDDGLPDKDVARDFYAKYEPKEVLGR